MIPDPQNDFERLQNDLAGQLMTATPFANLKMPDGSAWSVLTEDEGDIEFLFTKMIADCGLAVVVQTPTGQTSAKSRSIPGPRFDPVVLPVQVSEAVIFNRSDAGTKVRVQTAAYWVRSKLHLYTPAITAVRSPLVLMEVNRDRDRHPETGALVASVVCVFHAPLNEQSNTII